MGLLRYRLAASAFTSSVRDVSVMGSLTALATSTGGLIRIRMLATAATTRTAARGRALEALNIDIICANSPQAKGRVQRAFGTLQDRLVKELRLDILDRGCECRTG
jgi:hypothetical protein